MLRISKLTDYAVALTTHLARCQVGPYVPGSADARGDLQPGSGHAAVPAAPPGRAPAEHAEGPEPGYEPGHENVRALAAATGVPEPTVRKVLKTLAHAGIVDSVRGTHGGYALARPAADISVADVVIAVEGPIAVTECASEATAGACDLEGRCSVQGPWQRISAAIRDALDKLTLADMATPAPEAAGHAAHDPSIVPLRVPGVPLREPGVPLREPGVPLRAAGVPLPGSDRDAGGRSPAEPSTLRPNP